MRTKCVVFAALSLAGCSTLNGPWANGRLVTATEASTELSKSFKLTQGGDPLESTGTRGFGSTCDEAAKSTGSSTTTYTNAYTHTLEAVGNTFTDAPLVPGVDMFSDVGVTVIAHQTRGSRDVESVTVTIDTDDTETTDRSVTPSLSDTWARYYGLAADEFLVELSPLNLFVPVDFAMPSYSNSLDKGGREEMSVTMLTRRNPAVGEVWMSVDGNLLYKYAGKEDFTLGDRTLSADRVDIFTINNVDPKGSSVLDTCVFVKDDVATESGEVLAFGIPFDTDTGFSADTDETDVPEDTDVEPPGPTEVTNSVALLDKGCEDSFVHGQIGHELWFEDTLVFSNTTTHNVQVSDYGYEWYDDGDGACVRRTSTVKPTDEGDDAKLFVTYSVTTTTREYKATNIGSTTEE